jgi:hypothetical protein
MDPLATQYVALSIQELRTVRQALEHFTVYNPYPMDRQLARQALGIVMAARPLAAGPASISTVRDVDVPPIAARV